MSESRSEVSISEAALGFLASLPPEERQEKQQEINKFVLWYGRERTISSLTVSDVARYGDQWNLTPAEARRKFAPVRDFLTYAKKKGLVKISLASHLGAGRSSVKSGLAARKSARKKQQVVLTREAQAKMKSELAALKEERPRVAEEIRKAAADKDFRENAPLEAARERHEQLEARIKALESTLDHAVLEDKDSAQAQVVGLSCTITLRDLRSGEKLVYTLVSPNEIDPTQGRISVNSPVGKALVGRRQGEVVEVSAPLGKTSYRIEGIEQVV